jgi:hypothetical protein
MKNVLLPLISFSFMVMSAAADAQTTATFSVNPASITSGGSATLNWSSTNAASCTGTGFSTGGTTSGSVTVSPVVSTSYSISCIGAPATATKSITVVNSTLAPQLYEIFSPPNGSASQVGTAGLTTTDKIFQVDGPWTGTGGNLIEPNLAVFSKTDPSGVNDPAVGFLSLATTPSKQAAEIISNILPAYGYGYYEVRMIVDPQKVPGGVVSFFTIQAGGTLNAKTYGPKEFDIEFLTNESWLTSASAGAVHFTTHPSGATYKQTLNFNPALAYHRYGFLWVPGSLSFTVDGVIVHTVTNSDVTAAPTNGMFMMANVWTGNASWGGGPPVANFSGDYNWIKFWPSVTSVPAN